MVTKLVISELYIVMQNVAESRNKLQRPINLSLYRVMNKKPSALITLPFISLHFCIGEAFIKSPHKSLNTSVAIIIFLHSLDFSRDKEYISKYNLRRFVDAHRQIYSSALNEIRSSEKQSHWMWYIFPQLRGLGHSRNAEYYGIADRDEAVMFLHHPLLGRNLYEITMAMLTIDGKSAEEILGGIDALKFRSSMTLFDNICPNDIFSDALQKYYDGKVDERTLEMLQTGKVGNEHLISGGGKNARACPPAPVAFDPSLRKYADPFERDKIDPYREDSAGDFFIVLDSVLADGV